MELCNLVKMNILAYKNNRKLLVAVLLDIYYHSMLSPLKTIFLNNWIYSYKKSEEYPDNPLTMDQCLFLIQYHIIIGCFLGIIVSFLAGKFFDKL